MSIISLNNECFRIENVYGIGRNYAENIEELQHKKDEELLVFLKPNTAVSFAETPVRLPAYSRDVYYEAEIVLLIGHNSSENVFKDPLDYIAGYSIGLDLTAHDVQKAAVAAGLSWLKSKGFKQSALLADFIPAGQIKDALNINFTLNLNGKRVQTGNSSYMLHPIAEIIATLNKLYGLKKGDIIFTGTPSGAGKLHGGDELALDLADGLVVSRFLVAA